MLREPFMQDNSSLDVSILAWMAWTQPTAVFFVGIALILAIMTFYELKHSSVQRKGFLPIATTRGDRLFIALLSSAFLHLTILGATELSIWIALIASILLVIITLRWG